MKKKRHIANVPFEAPASFKDLTNQRNGGRLGIKILRRADKIARAVERLGGTLKHPLTNRFCSRLTYRQVMAEVLLKQELRGKKRLDQRIKQLKAKFS